jgi:hypothetical protein
VQKYLIELFDHYNVPRNTKNREEEKFGGKKSKDAAKEATHNEKLNPKSQIRIIS